MRGEIHLLRLADKAIHCSTQNRFVDRLEKECSTLLSRSDQEAGIAKELGQCLLRRPETAQSASRHNKYFEIGLSKTTAATESTLRSNYRLYTIGLLSTHFSKKVLNRT